MLDLVEAFSCVSRKRIRLIDVREFKDAHHIGTHSSNVNTSALDPACHGQVR